MFIRVFIFYSIGLYPQFSFGDLEYFKCTHTHTHTHTHNTLETSAPYFLEFVGAASRGFFLLSQSTYKTTVFYDFYSNGRLAPMIIVTDFVHRTRDRASYTLCINIHYYNNYRVFILVRLRLVFGVL